MSWLKSLFSNVLKGDSLVDQLGNAVDRFVTTGEEKHEMQVQKERLKAEVAQLVHEQELQMQNAELEATAEFNNRIKELEGTAADLIQAGWLGRIVLFLRGLQRPLWGYGTFYFNLQYFTGKIEMTPQGESLLYVIDILVLGFLFGERAVKNVAPMVKDILANRQAKTNSK